VTTIPDRTVSAAAIADLLARIDYRGGLALSAITQARSAKIRPRSGPPSGDVSAADTPAVRPVRSGSCRSSTSPASYTTPVPPPVTSIPRDHEKAGLRIVRLGYGHGECFLEVVRHFRGNCLPEADFTDQLTFAFEVLQIDGSPVSGVLMPQQRAI
jgi:hypothetical protein